MCLVLFVCFTSGPCGHMLFSLFRFSKVKSGKLRNESFTVTTHSDLLGTLVQEQVLSCGQTQSHSHRAKTRKQKVSGETVVLQRKLSFGGEWACVRVLCKHSRAKGHGVFENRALGQG